MYNNTTIHGINNIKIGKFISQIERPGIAVQFPTAASDYSLPQKSTLTLRHANWGLFHQGPGCQNTNMATHLHLQPRLRISRPIPPLSRTPSWHNFYLKKGQIDHISPRLYHVTKSRPPINHEVKLIHKRRIWREKKNRT